MSQQELESFGAYQKARQLFDLVVADMETVKKPALLSTCITTNGQRGFDLCKH
jgi:hypothetical protein